MISSWIAISLPPSAISTAGSIGYGLRYTTSGSFAQFDSRVLHDAPCFTG
jgi:hypothetical protein